LQERVLCLSEQNEMVDWYNWPECVLTGERPANDNRHWMLEGRIFFGKAPRKRPPKERQSERFGNEEKGA